MNLKSSISIIFCLLLSIVISAQSTAMEVYNIFQAKCASCHNNTNPQSGLDLEGVGATAQERLLDVYNKILNVNPNNAHAIAKGYKFVYPGRSDKSFLFRKIAQNFDESVHINLQEDGNMPPYGSDDLTEIEKEMIRQWILYGAPATGQVVDPQIIENYYTGPKEESFPDGPPSAPDPSEGFQIKMGPFFLNPAGTGFDEIEYYTKYALELAEDQEVARLDIKMSPYSHHFIIYNFDGSSNNIPAGLRTAANHSNISFSAVVTEATDLNLPSGTAFKWDNDLVLDLNSHYINYSPTSTFKAEAYVNVYTQDLGTAAQEMKTELYANLFIPIPNNGNSITHDQAIGTPSLGDVFVWGLMGHTHKYGTGYKIFERQGNTVGDILYDGACPGGIPDCVSPNFDYQHIPMRYFEPLRPTTITGSVGLQHEASWINDGPSPVGFGFTSDDEMQVMIMMYTDDIEGVGVANENIEVTEEYLVYPNPTSGTTTFLNQSMSSSFSVELFDMTGKQIRSFQNIASNQFDMERGDLRNGMYLYTIQNEGGKTQTGKLIFQ